MVYNLLKNDNDYINNSNNNSNIHNDSSGGYFSNNTNNKYNIFNKNKYKDNNNHDNHDNHDNKYHNDNKHNRRNRHNKHHKHYKSKKTSWTYKIAWGVVIISLLVILAIFIVSVIKKDKNSDELDAASQDILQKSFDKGYDDKMKNAKKNAKNVLSGNNTSSNTDTTDITDTDININTDIDTIVDTITDGDPRNETEKILDEIKNSPFFSNHNLEVLGVAVLSDMAIRAVFKKLVMKKFYSKASKTALMTSGKVLAKITEKYGAKALVKFGIKAGEKVAAKAMTTAATKASTVLASQASMAATTGPAAPIVEAVFLAFDAISLGLDIGDGGGYNKLSSIESYVKIRDTLNAELEKAHKEAGVLYPTIAGPLDLISQDILNDKILEKMQYIMAPKNKDPLSKPVRDALANDILNDVITLEEASDEDVILSYSNLLDIDAIYNKAFTMLCEENKGKIIIRDPTNNPNELSCSYANIDDCTNSYNWPIPDNSEVDTYVEFKNSQFGGACVVASFGVRTMCEANDLKYDQETGLCIEDENYCLMKGGTWEMNDNIGQMDCKIPMSQEIIEMIFGTTIVRGLMQLFGMNQYEKCKDDETDDGYFCRSRNCAEGEEFDLAGGICHTKCKPNYNSNGITMCWRNCPRIGPINVKNKCLDIPGNQRVNGNKLQLYDCNDSVAQQWYFNTVDNIIQLKNDTSFCLDITGGVIEEGTEIQLYKCGGDVDAQKFSYDIDNDSIHPYNRQDLCLDFDGVNANNGSHIKLVKCNGTDNQKFKMEQTNNDGATCRIAQGSRVADCPPGYTNWGATCHRDADSKTSDLGYGSKPTANCPEDSTNNGITCYYPGHSFQREYFSKAGQDVYSDRDDCENKYGNGNCEIQGVWGSRLARPKNCEIEARKFGYRYPERYTDDGLTTMGARCYRSPKTYGTISDVGECPPGYRTTGLAWCYVNCEEKYGPGYYNNGTSCWRDVSDLGMDSMTCKPGEFKTGARCYQEPPPHFTNMGEFMVHSRTSYDRGVGTPSVHIRPKKRIIEFSTQDN